MKIFFALLMQLAYNSSVALCLQRKKLLYVKGNPQGFPQKTRFLSNNAHLAFLFKRLKQLKAVNRQFDRGLFATMEGLVFKRQQKYTRNRVTGPFLHKMRMRLIAFRGSD